MTRAVDLGKILNSNHAPGINTHFCPHAVIVPSRIYKLRNSEERERALDLFPDVAVACERPLMP